MTKSPTTTTTNNNNNSNNNSNKFWVWMKTKLFKPKNEFISDIIEFICDVLTLLYFAAGVVIMILFGPLKRREDNSSNDEDNNKDDNNKDTWIIKMLKRLFLNPTTDKEKQEKAKSSSESESSSPSPSSLLSKGKVSAAITTQKAKAGATGGYVPEENENELTAQCRLDCDVCMIPLPLDSKQTSYQGCCGKTLCNGCIVKDVLLSIKEQEKMNNNNMNNHNMNNRNQRNQRTQTTKISISNKLCPFCRSKPPSNNKQVLEQTKNRIEKSNNTDRLAIYQMGLYYMDGQYGLKKDPSKAVELFERSAILGCPEAAHSLACIYDPKEIKWSCKDVKTDIKKQKMYLEQAAKGGHLIARHRLSYIYYEIEKDYKMAVYHGLISASNGNKSSLKVITNLYKLGYVTKDDFTNCLRSNQTANDDRISVDREIAQNVKTNHMEDLLDVDINNKSNKNNKKKQNNKKKKH